MTYKAYGPVGAVQHIESGNIYFPQGRGWEVYEAWLADGNTLQEDPADLAQLEKFALLQIDADVDAVYRAAVGDRAREYEIRENESRAYKAAGYTGTPGPYLTDFIDANGITAEVAADIVISQADAYALAMRAMSSQRLAAKAAVRAGSRATAMPAWNVFVAGLRAQLGLG